MSSDLTKRNVTALHAGLKECRRQNNELMNMFKTTQDQLTMVLAEQDQLKRQINILMAMKGTGATS